MFSSPGTPRRPQTATERLNVVRSNLHHLRESVQTSETFALAHLASNRGVAEPPASAKTKGSQPTVRANSSTPTVPALSEEGTLPLAASPPVERSITTHPPAITINAFDDTVLAMKHHAIKIEEHLAVEATARQEMDRKLKSLIDQKIREEVARLEKKAADRIVELHHQVESLTRRTESIQVELNAEREKNVRLTQELKYHVTHGVSEVREHVIQVRGASQSSQSILAKNLAENLLRLQEKLDVERHARESVMIAVRDEMETASKNRGKSDDRTLQKLRDDIVALEIQLKRERETRERGEEQLAATMEEVVAQIQLGLHNVTR